MEELERLSPLPIFLRKFPLLITAFAVPVHAARVADAYMRAFHHGLGLNFFHYLSHGLARPNAVFAD
jgi:hypothetical protein